MSLVVDLITSGDDADAQLAVEAFIEIPRELRFLDWLGVLGTAKVRGPEAEEAARWLREQFEAAAEEES
jgi:hypothetical protein